MQMDEYIYDPRFQIILVGIDGHYFSGTHREIRHWILANTNPEEDTFVAHNALFDGFILTQILGIKPRRWIDTLSLARVSLPYLPSHSLEKLAEHYKLAQKQSHILASFKGKRREDLSAHDIRTFGTYCLRDIDITRAICNRLVTTLPPHELDLIDMTVRMFTEPRIKLDSALLEQSYQHEVETKEKLLASVAADKKDLMSNPKFAGILKTFGVDPPMKVSSRTNEPTFAFAKSDKAFTALLEHPNEDVQALVAARLGVKTTITETRALRLLETSRRGQGLFPVALNYWGAKTTGRYSGGNKINAQNIPARGRGSELRAAMIAPPGKMIVVGDSANIELRVAMVCAKQNDAVRKLINKEDLYCDFATLIYDRLITEEDKDERFLGKVAMLSLQYGVGAAKFRETVRILMKKDIGDKEAQRIVNLYRDKYTEIVSFWGYCNNQVLTAINNGDQFIPVDRHKWFWTTKNGFSHGGDPGIVYNGLGKDPEGGWRYDKGKLYGGKVVENLAQHMARHIVLWQTAAINKLFPVSLSVHDEVVCVVDQKDVDECVRVVKGFLSEAPVWCRGYIPLGASVHAGRSYAEAKK
jgi:DNA polymerase